MTISGGSRPSCRRCRAIATTRRGWPRSTCRTMTIDRVREAAERHVGDTTVPGLVAVVARGDDVYVEAFGRLGVGRPAVQRDSLFRIASITKPITAAVTMALVDDGLIGLDQPVDRLLPELTEQRVLARP